MPLAGLFGLPAEWAAPTVFGFLVVVAVILYWLLRDRSAFKELERRIETQDREIKGLNRRIGIMEVSYDLQRTRAHRAVNELTKAEMILDIVNDLKANCTCEALLVVEPILDRWIENSEARREALKTIEPPPLR